MSAASQTSGLAIASLVLGILGLSAFPVLGSISALVLGYSARRELTSDPALAGDGLATAGIVLGWIGVAIIGLVIVLVLLASLSIGA